MLEEGFKQDGSSQIIYVGVFRDLVHALTDADNGNQVVNGVNIFQRFLHSGGIADVPDLKLDFSVQISRLLPRRTMHLCTKVVKHPYAVTVIQEFIGEVLTDESGTTGNQNELLH